MLNVKNTIEIKINKINGAIQAPGSKSYMQRAIAIAMLTKGETKIHNPIFCDDTRAVLKIAEDFGATICYRDNYIIINGNFKVLNNKINLGESALAMRMLTPILSLLETEILITGQGTLLNRPLNMVEDALKQLNVNISTNNGFLPVKIKGPIHTKEITIDASISSQTLSGLLIALPLVKNDTVINVSSLNSKPYVQMTLDIIEQFGIQIINENFQKFYIKGRQNYKPIDYHIEGDWSNSAYLLVAAAIKGEIEINNLNPFSAQGDKIIIDILKKVGANIEIRDNKILCEKNCLKPFAFDATHYPDLFPPLVVLAAAIKGKSKIYGVKRLFYKESNRANILMTEFNKTGININIFEDCMTIIGNKPQSAVINSYRDHRIVMAAAIFSLLTDKSMKILNFSAINKSFPDFLRTIAMLANRNFYICFK